MASFKISALKPTTLLDDTTTIPCFYNGKTYQLSIATLTSYFGTGTFKAIFSGDSIECSPNPISTSGNISFRSPGLMSLYAGNSDPSGWLICNGRELPKSNPTYSNLYAVIGDRYGTPSNSSVFKIPNTSGLSVFGLDNMNGVASERLTAENLDGGVPTTLGSIGGNQPQTLTPENCPLSPHSHNSGTINWVVAFGNGCTAGGYSNFGGVRRSFRFSNEDYLADTATPANNQRYWNRADANIKTMNVSSTDQVATTLTHPHIPPLILLNWIIKL